MADSKFFQRGKTQELRAELVDGIREGKTTGKRNALKKIVANMTMGNDMAPLFGEVMSCMQTPSLEIKKMVYLYLIHYAKLRADLANLAVTNLTADTRDANPLVRALALRTMAYIPLPKFAESLVQPLRAAFKDSDAYVRKTAALCVCKMYTHSPELMESGNFVDSVHRLLGDGNATVVASAVVALMDINLKSEKFDLVVDVNMASRLLTAINECNEWSQAFLLEALMRYVPQETGDAESIIDRVTQRLQHANSAVVLSAVKVIFYLANYIADEQYIESAFKKCGPPLVTLLSGSPEIQYVALRNILLILQRQKTIMKRDIKAFFCKYNDPIYVKLTKLEIIVRLTDESNVDLVLMELKEYSTEIDVDFVRRAVRCIGRCAINIEIAADKCIEALVSLIQTKVNYVVQESTVVIKDIFRRYPNRYESIIATLCDNLDSLDEPEAKSSMLWIIGQYADRIDNADSLLEGFMETFREDPQEVQLALLTAMIKLFLKKPAAGKELVPKLLKWCTEETDNPDVRDRGFMYWRLLSSNPAAAKAIVFAERPHISADAENFEPNLLDELLLSISTLASIYHRPPQTFIGDARPQVLHPSPVLVHHMRGNVAASIAGTTVGAANNAPSHAYLDGGDGTGGLHYGNAPTSDAQKRQIENLLDLDMTEPGAGAGMANGGLQNTYNEGEDVSYLSDNLQQLLRVSGNNQESQSINVQQPYGGSESLKAHSQQQPSSFAPELAGVHVRQEPFIAPPTMVLDASRGKGLEVLASFARRAGRMSMELTFINRALVPLADFAIQFNKNSFALVPSEPLQLRAIAPGEHLCASLGLTLSPGSHTSATSPVNNLQIALKSSAGIFYFQTLVPLYLFFRDDGAVEQSDFLRLWGELGEAGETKGAIRNVDLGAGGRSQAAESLKQRLGRNNIFTVAMREIDDQVVLYVGCKAPDGPASQSFLAELRYTRGGEDALAVAVRTAARPLAPLWISAVEAIVQRGAGETFIGL